METKFGISKEKILEQVCYYFDSTPEELYSSASIKKVVIPRNVYVYLLAKLTNMDANEISALFGRKWSTVHTSNKWMYKEQVDNTQISRIAKKIENELISQIA